jgi:tagaturonate reductase
MTRRIVQFGTSRFLHSHVDLFVHEARRSGEDIGPITVVKTSRAADRGQRTFCRHFGRPHRLRADRADRRCR